MMVNKASAHHWETAFAQEIAPRQTFTYSKSTIEILKESVKYVQS